VIARTGGWWVEEKVEAELEHRQSGTLYTVGRALRATYDAENHHTLGRDVTGLMLDLARVPTDAPTPPPAAVAAPPPPRRGLFDWVRSWRARPVPPATRAD
jgi:hypothetical protein